jgi:hypothetical protein
LSEFEELILNDLWGFKVYLLNGGDLRHLSLYAFDLLFFVEVELGVPGTLTSFIESRGFEPIVAVAVVGFFASDVLIGFSEDEEELVKGKAG